MSAASAMCSLCQEWTQAVSNDERDLLRLLSPTPGHPAPTDMSHYCLQNAARRVLDRAPEHPPASPPLPLPCPCIQDLPRPRLEAQHLDTWLHACSPTSHAATDSMLAQSTTRTVAGTRCCGRASTSCASTARTRFHVVRKITALRLSDLAHRPAPLRVALVLQRGSTK